LISQSEDDKKNQARLQDIVNSLESKIKVFKKQIEQAEEIAAANLSKYRRAQIELEDAAKRADEAENRRAKSRAQNRSTVTPQVN
jgi:hypothetical protein